MHRLMHPVRASALVLAAVVVLAPAYVRAAGPSGFDGTYTGVGAPQWLIRGCGRGETSVTFEVKGGQAWTHHHHLEGTVDGAGNLTMQDDSGRAQLIGTIRGNAFTGTETVMKSPKKLRGFYDNGETQCTLSVTATRD